MLGFPFSQLKVTFRRGSENGQPSEVGPSAALGGRWDQGLSPGISAVCDKNPCVCVCVFVASALFRGGEGWLKGGPKQRNPPILGVHQDNLHIQN